jgi:hypothetical protein
MKNESRVPRRAIIHKRVSLPNPPLTADELIDLYERSYNASVKSLGGIVGKVLPVILLLENILIQGVADETLLVRLKDRNVDYCTTDDGVAEILGTLPALLFEAWNSIDEDSLKIWSAVERYRKAHPKVTSA